MNTENTLFDIAAEPVSPSKKPVKKAAKAKKSAALYAGFTAQEIMEFFDWGFMFPNAYLPSLLGENDLRARFESLQLEYVVLLVEKPAAPNYYYLEFDQGEIEVFLNPLKEGTYGSETPIPVHFVKKIICPGAKAKNEFSRLWGFTDNDEIVFEIGDYENATNEPLSDFSEPSQQKKERVLQFIQQLDRILGAICFTKGLDPFIEFNFAQGKEKEPNPIPLYTISPRYIALLKQWMPKKNKNMFENILSADPGSDKRYTGFFDRLVSMQWDGTSIDAILKSMTENDKAETILSQILGNPTDDEQSRVYQKISKAIKEIDLGIVDVQTALSDEDLKKPDAIFLVLLKMYYRKGKNETDALGFRVSLFEKDFIKNPRQASLIGTLYGYYTGYHNLRKNENIPLLGEIDLLADQKIAGMFRLKLSPNDNFESESLNVFYNRLSEIYADINMPQVKINFTTPKEPTTGATTNATNQYTRLSYTFTPVPMLGKYGYSIELANPSNKPVERPLDKVIDKPIAKPIEKVFDNPVVILIDLLSLILKQKHFKVAACALVMTLLKSEQIPNSNILRNGLLQIQNGEITIDMEIDLPALQTVLGNQLSTQKNATRCLASIEKLSKILSSFTNQ